MVAMAARKRTPSDLPPADDSDRKRDVMSFRTNPKLRAAIELAARLERRSQSQMIEMLLEEALARRGLWSVEDDQAS